MLKKEKGITLIALIITIIVMLILVGVTINVALNGGLFTKASDASKQMQIEADKEELQIEVLTAYNEKTGKLDLSVLKTNLERKGWNITVSGETAICISPKENTYTVDANGKITGGNGSNPGTDLPDGALITMYRAGENCNEENCTNEEHLHIGDYVSYTPDETVTTYYPDGEEISNIGINTGYITDAGATSLQVVEQKTLNWRVLGASGDNVLLISETPTTTGSISFYGHIGYNNNETILNTACETLYSKSGIGTARSITLDDIDTYLDGSNYDKNTFGKEQEEADSGFYGYTNSNIVSEFDYNSSTNTLTKLPEGETKTLSLTSNAYYYMANEYIKNPIKLNLLQGTNSEYVYWIASRTVWITDKSAYWCLNAVGDGLICAFNNGFCSSYGLEDIQIAPLRPVVTLSSNVTKTEVSKTLAN